MKALYKLGYSNNSVWMSYFDAGSETFRFTHYLAQPLTLPRVQEFIAKQRKLATKCNAEVKVAPGLAAFIGELAKEQYFRQSERELTRQQGAL